MKDGHELQGQHNEYVVAYIIRETSSQGFSAVAVCKRQVVFRAQMRNAVPRCHDGIHVRVEVLREYG